MTLYIDTTDFNAVTFALVGSKKSISKNYKVDPYQSHEILGSLRKFLKSAKIETAEIKKIIVNKGPGSFTGTRIGVTHALALSFAWKIPIKPLGKESFLKEFKKITG